MNSPRFSKRHIISAAVLAAALVLLAGCAATPETQPRPAGDSRGEPHEPPQPPEPEAMQIPVESELASWFDHDGNGTLDQEEVQRLRVAVFRMVHEEHEVRNPLDELLDENGDGRVEPFEAMPVLAAVVAERLHMLHEFAPQFVPAFDANEDGRLDGDEVGLALDYLIFDPELRRPHPIWHRADRFMDTNGDGEVDERELGQVLGPLSVRIITHPIDIRPMVEEIRASQAAPHPVETLLDELADLNRNGMLEEEERELLNMGMRGPHPVETAFDELLDFDDNGEVDEYELAEADRAGGIVMHIPEQFEMRADTETDRLLDGNDDGVVSAREVEFAAFRLLAFPHEREDRHPLDRLADENNNGFIEEPELIMVLDRFFRPHPVDREMPSDRELNRNESGFIEPAEIGIAMGFEVGAPFPPIEELAYAARLRVEMIERLRGDGRIAERDAGEPEEDATAAEQPDTDEGTVAIDTDEDATLIQRRLGLIEDTEVAVVGISGATESITQETLNGLVVFVENAFVNVNRVTVVDRQNIDAIISEYEFQVSDLTDRETAVEIGQLTGADAIVVGSLSAVGSQYYLNIKLISVETGEILGSSIADAGDEDEFFTMCNNAVYRLFQL